MLQVSVTVPLIQNSCYAVGAFNCWYVGIVVVGEDVCLIEVNARIAGEVRGGELES